MIEIMLLNGAKLHFDFYRINITHHMVSIVSIYQFTFSFQEREKMPYHVSNMVIRDEAIDSLFFICRQLCADNKMNHKKVVYEKINVSVRYWFMLVLFCYLAGCSRGDNPNASRKTFVLVHTEPGRRPYVWDMVKSSTEAKREQKVIVVELPAHGSDMTTPAAVSIDVYRDKVIVTAVQSVNGKVILVGHSMGGVVVTATLQKKFLLK